MYGTVVPPYIVVRRVGLNSISVKRKVSQVLSLIRVYQLTVYSRGQGHIFGARRITIPTQQTPGVLLAGVVATDCGPTIDVWLNGTLTSRAGALYA